MFVMFGTVFDLLSLPLLVFFFLFLFSQVLQRSTKAKVLDAWVSAGGLAPLGQWLADFAAAFDDEACQILLHLLATLPGLHPDRIKESGLGKLVGKLRKDYGPGTGTAAGKAATASGDMEGGGNGEASEESAAAAAAAAAVTRGMATRVAVTWRLLLRGVSDSGAKALGAPPDAAAAAAAAGKRGVVPGAAGGGPSSSDPRASKRPRAAADVMGDALGGGVSGVSGKSRANMAPRDRAAEMRKLREERIAQRRALKKGEALTHVMASKPGSASSSVGAAMAAQSPSSSLSSLLPGPKKLSAEQLAARQAHVSKERAERQANLLERSRAAAAAAASSNGPSAASSSSDGSTTRLYGARDSSAVPDAFQPISSMDQGFDNDEYEAGSAFYGDQSDGSSFGGGSGGASGGGAGKSAGKKLRWLDEEGGELEAVREFVTEKGGSGREGDQDEGVSSGGGGGGGSLAEKRRDEANKEKQQMEEARAALEAEKAEARAAAWAAVEAMASGCWPKQQLKRKGEGVKTEGDEEGNAAEEEAEEEEDVGYRSPAALGGGLAVDRDDGDGLDSMEVKLIRK
jgi:hypothetical protein